MFSTPEVHLFEQRLTLETTVESFGKAFKHACGCLIRRGDGGFDELDIATVFAFEHILDEPACETVASGVSVNGDLPDE